VFERRGSGFVRVAVKGITFEEIPASRKAFAAVMVGAPAMTKVEEASVGVNIGPVCTFPERSFTTIPSGTPGHE
jgi:hypothetical protein